MLCREVFPIDFPWTPFSLSLHLQLGNCTITKKKQIDKFKRGEMDRRTATGNELTIVGWKDNKSVYVASNCDSNESMSTLQGWNKDTQAKIAVPQPFFIDQYNKGTVGVDKANQNIATDHIANKTKKLWWWALFVWIPGLIV